MRAVIMGMRLILVAAAIISVTGIKVPVEKTDENITQTKNDDAVASEKPIYYESKDDQVDSYRVRPSSYRPLEDISDDIATLATYLLPPSEDKSSNYYKPTEAGKQTDWYPIAPAISPLSRQLLPPKQPGNNPVPIEVNQSEPIYGQLRTGQLLDIRGKHVPVPPRDLQPPLENAPNEYVASISEAGIDIPFDNEYTAGYPLTFWNGPPTSVPNNIRTDNFARITKKYKNPTKLYPKKYAGAIKPIPIPVKQFNDGSLTEKETLKTLKEFKTNQNIDNEYKAPSKDKPIHNFEGVQKKHLLVRKPDSIKVEELETSESNEDVPSQEQDTSASNYREQQPYSAPLRQAPKPVPVNNHSHASSVEGDRTEFRMHGMKGPHSYQFGFDTGKGKNRQFRYEERDNDGRVKGHYGYMDKNGKLRVVNYDADPEHGFRADPPVETK